MSHVSLILPYVIEDADRKKPFTYDMEVAAILCLAEAERKMRGILRVSPERISFISKLYYPLWAVPWENECFITDGLGIFSYTIVHMKPPDVKFFTEDIKRSTETRELYRGALRRHAETFNNFIETAQIPIEAIISNKKLLSIIVEYVKQGVVLKENALKPSTLIPPKLDEKAALREAEKIVDHWRQIQSEIKGLQYAIDVLSEEATFHEQKILLEIEQIQETYGNEILRIRPAVEKRIERLMIERDAKIKRYVQATERKLKAAMDERDKHERRLQNFERKKDNFQRKREACKRRGDKSVVSRWNREIKKCQDEISLIKRKIQDLSQLIERTRNDSETTIKKLNEDYQTIINLERKRITDLEDSSASEIANKRKEIEGSRSEASSIISLIRQLIEQKRMHASKLKEMTILWKPEGVSLICVPFYLVRYEAEAKSRYHVYAPVIAVGYEGIIKSIQKTIRSFSFKSRIKLLLRSRSETLKEMLASVLAKTMEDKAFEEILYRIGCSNNLLNIPDLKETLNMGMEELKNEGWVNPEEKDATLNTYSPH